MTPSHSPSEEIQVPPSTESTKEILKSEAQTHVDTVVKQVNDIFDANPEEKEVVYEALKNLLSMLILKYPGKLAEILDQVDKKYQERLKWFGYKTYERRQEAIDQYTKFLNEMGNDITTKAQHVWWQKEYEGIEIWYLTKKISLIDTYTRILQDLKSVK